jgi:hypothetical protein
VTGYRVSVGEASGVYTQTFDVGNVTSFVFASGLPYTRYYFAVAAYAPGTGDGPRSSEVSAVVQAWPPPPPPPPPPTTTTGPAPTPGTTSTTSTTSTTTTLGTTPTGQLTHASSGPAVVLQPAELSGASVSLRWSSFGASNIVEYLLEVGTAPGLSNLFNGSLGAASSIRGTVAPGTYFVRVRARRSDSTILVSNEVSFSTGISSSNSAGCTAPPAAPVDVSGLVAGGNATVRWTAAPGATSYIVQAGTAPGLSDIFHGNIGPSNLVAAEVGGGFSAYVRIVAVNACGTSAASEEILLQ